MILRPVFLGFHFKILHTLDAAPSIATALLMAFAHLRRAEAFSAARLRSWTIAILYVNLLDLLLRGDLYMLLQFNASSSCSRAVTEKKIGEVGSDSAHFLRFQ